MKYDVDHEPTITLQFALDSMTAHELRKLVALTGQKAPPVKADMVAVIVQPLAGEHLRTVWDGLDELQQAAVAEAAYSPSSQFYPGQFRAKYGGDPAWVFEGKTSYDSKPTALCLFLYRNSVLPVDLKARLLKFVPEPRRLTVPTLDALPPTYPRPFDHWNATTRIREQGFEEVPLAVHETERRAQRELLSILRLADAGKIAVSDKTRRASAAALDAIGAILEGGDYYPEAAPTDRQDSNTGPIRAFAWPLLIQAGVTVRNRRCGQSTHLIRGFSQMPGTHSLPHARAYPDFPVRRLSKRRG